MHKVLNQTILWLVRKIVKEYNPTNDTRTKESHGAQHRRQQPQIQTGDPTGMAVIPRMLLTSVRAADYGQPRRVSTCRNCCMTTKDEMFWAYTIFHVNVLRCMLMNRWDAPQKADSKDIVLTYAFTNQTNPM